MPKIAKNHTDIEQKYRPYRIMKLENVVQSACMYTMSHHRVEPGDEVALGGWVKNSLLGQERRSHAPTHSHYGLA